MTTPPLYVAGLLNRDKYAALYSRLERKYCVPTAQLAILRALSDAISSATEIPDVPDSVEITTNSYEGGSATGSLVFEKSLALLVVEDLLRKYDPALACLNPTVHVASGWMQPLSP